MVLTAIVSSSVSNARKEQIAPMDSKTSAYRSPHRPRRTRVVLGLSGLLLAGSIAVPPAGLAHRHNRDVCGPDVNELAAGVLSALVGSSVARADSFEVHREADACGIPEKKSTFLNDTDFAVEHTFAKGHSKSTQYSVEVRGGFKGAFSATMGYKSDTTSSEEFRSTVEIPPHRGAELSASPSLHLIEGTWKHGRWWNKKKTHVSVSRPTGHIKWLLRETHQ